MGFANYIKSLYNGDYPEVGQVFFVVDSDYRTDVQGWSQADGTGPLDLWTQRNTGRVFRTGDYTNDAACVQAAIDAAVDFRGDTICFTPGNYSLGTALAINVPGLRLVGPPVRSARQSRVTLTDTVGDHAISVDDVEIAFLRIVPLTAQNFFQIADGADNGYIHHVYYDSQGVDASTSTEFLRTAATTKNWLVEDCAFVVDALQGDCFTWTTALHWLVRRCHFMTKVASYATVFTLATNCEGNVVEDCTFTADADGTYTNIFTGATNENGQLLVKDCTINGTALATATAIETGFGTTTDIEIANCVQTGDASGDGGVAITLA